MIQNYQVHMDYEGFRELFVAQQRRYLMKIGIWCTVFCVPLSLFAIYITASEFSLEYLGMTVLFVLLAALGIADIIKPPAMLVTRKPLVYMWFYEHGVPEPDKVEFKQLTADYTVSLGAYGFSEDSAAFSLNTPWLQLREKPVTDARGTYFVVDDGKESSALYNMMGINWALREETVTGVLFIPKAVTDADPGLVEQISGLIAGARKAVRGKEMTTQQAAAIKEWVAASGPRQ